MRSRFTLICALFLSLLPIYSQAETVATESAPEPYQCLDAAGKPVPGVTDTGAALAFQTRIENGQATIRYNPERLARLSLQATLFLYAQECARLNMGMAGEQQITLTQARQADCRAIDQLRRDQRILPEEVALIESDLILSPQEWQQTSGPERGFDLTRCDGDQPSAVQLQAPAPQQAATAQAQHGNVLALPAGAKPASASWNACVRRCAQPMLRCGNNAGCLQAPQNCVAACS